MSDSALRYAATMRGFRVSAYALVSNTRRELGQGETALPEPADQIETRLPAKRPPTPTSGTGSR